MVPVDTTLHDPPLHRSARIRSCGDNEDPTVVPPTARQKRAPTHDTPFSWAPATLVIAGVMSTLQPALFRDPISGVHWPDLMYHPTALQSKALVHDTAFNCSFTAPGSWIVDDVVFVKFRGAACSPRATAPAVAAQSTVAIAAPTKTIALARDGRVDSLVLMYRAPRIPSFA